MIKTLLLLLVLYISYKFIVNILVPLWRAFRQVKQFQQKARDHMESQHTSYGDVHIKYKEEVSSGKSNGSTGPLGKNEDGEYIEYEEVK